MHAAKADLVVVLLGSFSYAVKLINLTKFILKLMTELTFSENSRLSRQICFSTVFVQIANAECVAPKHYQVLTRVNSNLTGYYQNRAKGGL
jgi:hypothetical protein